MKKLAFVFAIVAVFSGCATTRQVQVVREVQKDTLNLNHIQYDSIYVDNWQLTDRSRDTIYLEKSHIEYRYKLLRDTVRIVQIDSIPVIREVEVVKTERYIPKVYKASFWICVIFIFCAICTFIMKFK